jgi:alpha-tubulin suppressor-like RCC1 family protein
MFMILVAAVGATSSARVALDAQYYDSLARDAAESGASQAAECLKLNNYIATWSASAPLRPNTTCSGGPACMDVAKCFIVKTPTYSTSYSVGAVTDDGTGTQTFNVTATVNLLRKSDGATAKTYSRVLGTQVGSQVTTTSVVFGYNSNGSFFATVGRDGIMRAAGWNGWGILGNGTYSDTLIPTKFKAPTTFPIVSGYSNFLSVGYALYGIDSQGNAFGAGYNGAGQIGSGSTATYVPTPEKVAIPGNKPVQKVIVGGWTNYFLTTDGNLYAAGECDQGRLGSNYPITGCADQALPIRVNLPTPNPADPNTIPTTDIVSDRYTTFVRMVGGRVYGWGDDEYGELGDDAYTPHSSPVQIGTYGNTGQPKATQIAFDGNSIYVLDDAGKLNSMGFSNYGNRGNRTVSLYNPQTSRCFDNTNADGVSIRLYTCNSTPAQQFQYRSDNSIYNANVGKCLDNTNADGISLHLNTCNGTPAQKFTWDPWAYQFVNPQSGKCIDNKNGDAVTLWLYTCNNTVAQNYAMTTTWLSPFNMTGINGQFTAITTDQWHITALTTTGEVWSAGINTSGMFGNGTSNMFQPDPIKFQLPAGVTGKYIYATNSGASTDPAYKNLLVIGNNGKVYGAGGNSFGQLGNGATAVTQKTPVAMNVIDGVNITAREVQVGAGTSVIYTTSGRVYTVGRNDSGQLGDGTTTNRSTPYLSQYINASAPTQY